jgi:hypothetical protein
VCCGSGSARIRNLLSDLDTDSELEILDPDPAQELELELDVNLDKITKITAAF